MRNLIVIATLGVFALPGQTQDETMAATMTAAAFSVERFSLSDGYHATRADDLKCGRSEHHEGGLVRQTAAVTI
jgi:hypothetical protein